MHMGKVSVVDRWIFYFGLGLYCLLELVGLGRRTRRWWLRYELYSYTEMENPRVYVTCSESSVIGINTLPAYLWQNSKPLHINPRHLTHFNVTENKGCSLIICAHGRPVASFIVHPATGKCVIGSVRLVWPQL